jgi:hypothetical protein
MSQDQIGFRSNYPMTKILDRLYLGGFKNAEDLGGLNPEGFTHILNCTSETLQLSRRRFKIIQMDQLDGHPWNVQKLYSAVEWLRNAMISGGKALVQCHAGVSRSPVLTACYLYTVGFDFDNALDQIKRVRPIVNPAPSILISAKHAFGVSAASGVIVP